MIFCREQNKNFKMRRGIADGVILCCRRGGQGEEDVKFFTITKQGQWEVWYLVPGTTTACSTLCQTIQN